MQRLTLSTKSELPVIAASMLKPKIKTRIFKIIKGNTPLANVVQHAKNKIYKNLYL